jgi:predicted S18 family serine protease
MTGTVNPDGTVGPVGGIPNKFRAAVKAGKKILGYPVGQRYSTDLASQKVVDLEEFAKENGVQAFEMNTIFDSYKLLTGLEFPRPQALNAADMALPDLTLKFLKERTTVWTGRYNNFAKLFYDEKLQDLYDSAKKLEVARLYFQTAEELFKAGNYPTSYDYAQRSGGNAFTAYAYGRFVALVMQQRFPDLLNMVSSMFSPVGAALDQMFDISKKFKPKTVGELNSFISAVEQSVSALGYTQDAAKSVDAARNLMANAAELLAKKVPINQIKAEIINQLLNSSLRYGIALLKLEKAKDLMELKDPNNIPLTIDPARLEETAKTYIAVAQANLNYIDQIFIPDFARSAQTDEDSVRSRLMRNNNHYLVAITSLRFPQTIMKEKWGEKALETFYAQIAGSMGSYYSSSMFLMHHYSLGVRKEDGGVESVKMEKALINMLEHAEKNVRIYAALVQKTVGTVPVPARFFYSVGMTMKSGETSLKVKALEMFWRASMQCQLTLQLAKK